MGRGVSGVVLLDAPRGTIRIDLARVRVQRKSLLELAGVAAVPPGLHRLEVHDGDRAAVAWLNMEPGKLVVKAWDGGLLVDPDPFRHAQVQGLSAEEGIEQHLVAYPAGPNALWPVLVGPIQALGREPPAVRPGDPAGHPTPLEAALSGTHGGRAPSFLAELAQAFIVGFIDEEEAAQDRWRHLAHAIYAGAGLVSKFPDLFPAALDLLIAQQQLLPVELSPDAVHAKDARLLAQALSKGGAPLADAGRRLVEHMAQRGLG